MTVRSKIALASLVLTCICLVVCANAWRSQQRLSGLAINLYDQAFVAQDFLGRAMQGFDALAAQHSSGPLTTAEQHKAVPTILINLDITETSVKSVRIRAAIRQVRTAVAVLTLASGDQVKPCMANIAAAFARVARRLSNNGLAQRDEAEALAAHTRRLLILVLGSALVGLTATGWLLTRSIVPPLHQAAADMVRLCRGEVDAEVSGTARRDEIGDLCRSIGVFRQALLDNRLYNARFKAALDNMTQGLCLFDAQECLVVHNSRFSTMFGDLPEGSTVSALLADTQIGKMFLPPSLAHDSGPEEHFHDLPDGRIIRLSSQTIPGAGWVATYEDVTERRRWQDQLSHMARHDPLTGLPNRVAFRERIDQLLHRSCSTEQAAILYLDLDGFKTVNDTLGHPIGDELLRAVSARLLSCVKSEDLVARLGGDEFAIIQSDVAQLSQTASLCDRIVDVLRDRFCLDGHNVTIGTSIGVALTDETATADGLLRRADIALYRAKADGRGTWRLFESEMDAELQARHSLERDLQRALAAAEFELYYQPLVDARASTLTGFEALIRWNHPERGLISPAEFIPLAEKTGLIKAMGSWILEQACADASKWPSHVKVAVNLSPVQFQKAAGLIDDVEHALAASRLAANRLELEITESVLLQDSAFTLDILHRLRNLGVRISMDDFGTGYSSLSYLRQFPFDKIKIDQSFVRSMSSETGSVEIIRAVIGLGKALHMDVLAEGVETVEQLERLQREGCNQIQGYIFSKPKPLAELPPIIQKYSPCDDGLECYKHDQPGTPSLQLECITV